ncbi:Storkhead-box protein 1, partial [Bienertia sinuspersici]
GYSSTQGEVGYLDDKDYDVSHAYVVSNCETLKEYESLFEEEMMRTHNCLNVDNVWAKYQHNGLEDLTQVNREDQDHEEDNRFEIVQDEYDDNEESSSDMGEDQLEEEENDLDNYSNDETDESDDDDL